MCVNGCVGFIMMITLLYNLGDIDTVLESATGYPFIQIFYDSVNNYAGATVMGAVVLLLSEYYNHSELNTAISLGRFLHDPVLITPSCSMGMCHWYHYHCLTYDLVVC